MYLRIKYSEVLATLVILLAFLGNQCSLLFGISGGVVFKLFYFSKYIMCFIFITYYIQNKKKAIIDVKSRRSFIKLAIPLFILMILVELQAQFFSSVPKTYGLRYWSRSLSIVIDRFCIWSTCFLIWAFLGKRSLSCITRAVILDSLLVLICAPIKVGFDGIVSSIACILNGSHNNFFEVHELTFAIGMLIIYYCFFDNKLNNKKRQLLLFFLILNFVLGNKRIGILAIFVSGIFSFFVSRKEISKRNLNLIGILGIIICFVYIWIIYENIFFRILIEIGVSSSGRDIIYGYFTRRTSFSMSQYGWGIAGISKVIENWDPVEVMYMESVAGLHNDILSVFINFGFWGSICWFIYYLLYLPNEIYNKFSKRAATVYISLLIYLFITYLTDNTANYFICQIILLSIPVSIVSNELEKNGRYN